MSSASRAGEAGRDGGGTAGVAAPGGARLRIYHGPKNITGIGRYLADWQRSHGAKADFIVYDDDTTRQNHHRNLHLESKSGLGAAWTKLVFTAKCLRDYDVFHFYFGESLLSLGLKWPLPFNLDLPLLRLFGKTIVMTYCGSDIRLQEVERRRNPYAKLVEEAGKFGRGYDRRKKLRMRWQSLFVDRFTAVRNLYAHAITSIPERKIERHIEVNTTVDIGAYPPGECTTKETPVIVHAPSSPKFKGTEYIEAAVAELEREGYKFEYRRLHGVPNDEAHRIYREEADIIVDQILGGGFGTLAVEGMYYGRPVCCYLIDEMYEVYPDCPIVNCNVDNFREKLAWLVDHPEERTRLGALGRAFVEKHFSREEVNRKVWEMYLGLLRRRRRTGG
jgi:glycosyltransferase involved in cell wall biosynthesis